ncbi:MAG: YceI family protein, partial [Pseudomonadota bacterium]
DTNHKKRDQHLRAGDFLNVEAYPTMRFVGRNLVMHDRQTGRLEGDLTMLGVTKPVSLDLVVRKIGAVPIPSYKGATTIGIEATGVIQRSEFGMNTFLGPIGDAIYLDFHLDLVDCNPQTNSSPACQR